MKVGRLRASGVDLAAETLTEAIAAWILNQKVRYEQVWKVRGEQYISASSLESRRRHDAQTWRVLGPGPWPNGNGLAGSIRHMICHSHEPLAQW